VDRRVLVVDPDAEALAHVALGLRRRGMRVQIANSAAMACECAKQASFDAVVVWHALAETSTDAMGCLDALAVETGRVPPFLLLVDDVDAPSRSDRELRFDIDGICAWLEQIPPGAPPSSPSVAEDPPSAVPAARTPSTPPDALTGLFSRTPLRDVLLALASDQHTGTLTVTTPHGAGELRLHDGDVVDAVYSRLEGSKAVARLLGEHDGSFIFLPRTPLVMRRITTPLPELLGACDADNASAQAARAVLGDVGDGALFAVDGGGSGGPQGDFSDLARAVLTRLRAPVTLDDLLDEMPAPDADVLHAVRELDGAGRIKRLSHPLERAPIVGPEGLHAMRALAARAKAPGYQGAARVVFAGTPGRLSVVAHSALSLVDAVGAPEGQPAVPAPYIMASVRLGDDVGLDLVALPLVPAYGPLWPMALAGSAVVVRLDDAAAQALTDACAAAEILVVDVASLVPEFDEGNVALVAAAVRAALEGATV
jgi:hypothetical protein